MYSFDLLENFVENPNALLRRTKAKLRKAKVLKQEDIHHIRRSLTPEFEDMANKTLHEFSAPTTANIHTGPPTDVGNEGFELKPALINMV